MAENFSVVKDSGASWFGSEHWVPGSTTGFSLTATNISGKTAILKAIQMGVTACNSDGKQFTVDLGSSYAKRGPANGAGCSLYAQFTYGGKTYTSNTVSIPSVNRKNVGTRKNADGTYYGGQDYDDPYNFAFYPYYEEDYISEGKAPIFNFNNPPSINNNDSVTIRFFVPSGGWNSSAFSGSEYLQISSRAPISEVEPDIYRITYNANGGANPPAATDVTAGESVTNPGGPSTAPTYAVSWNVHGGTSVTTPVNRSRSFSGWYTAASGGTKITWPYTPTADIILYAHWGTATAGTLPTTTKTGYKLKGWYTAASGGSPVSSSTEVSSAVTYHAQWTPISYTVKYYLDGTEQTSLAQSCSYDSDYTYKSLPSKTGHSVDGWWANSSGTGTKYTAGGSFSNLSTTDGATISRYAKSTPNTYTVQYNANGGTGAPSAQTKTYGVDLTLSSTKPTKSFQLTYDARSGTLPSGTTNPVTKNCTFNNWKATDGTTYSSGGTYKKNEGTTLTAQWTNPTLGTLPTPTRTNYRFLGWYTSATGGSAVTSSTTMSEDRIIYAHWVEQVTLTYNTNGGSGSVSAETKDTGSEFTIKNYSGTKSENVTYYANGGSFSGNASTTKAGNMVFKGWADSSSATTAQYIYNDPTKGKITLTANKTIYGVWSHGSVSSHPTITAKQVTLTYNPNGGTIPTVANRTKKVNLVHSGWATTQAKANAGTVDYGVSAAIPTGTTVYAVWSAGAIGTLPTISIFTSRTGYRLDVDKPWTTTQNGSTAVTSTTKISVDTTIYAKWEYRVLINGNGGFIYTDAVEGVSTLEHWKKHGVNYTTPSTIIYDEGDPDASESRTFLGYATTATGAKAYNPGFSYTSNEPKTLYAVFQIKQYTVKFTDGYSVPEVVLKTQTVNHGGNATPPANPTRSGFTFSGWIGTYTNVKIDTTVKAGWGFCPIWIKTSTGWRKYDPKEE